MQHAAHMLAYVRSSRFSPLHPVVRMGVEKYCREMSYASLFPNVRKTYTTRGMMQKMAKITREVNDFFLASHMIDRKKPVIQSCAHPKGGHIIVADFGPDEYTPDHHHLAMLLTHRGVCVYRHPSK